MHDATGDSLAKARLELERDDELAALDALLKAWSATRSEVLAELVRLQSARLEPFAPEIVLRRPIFQPQWLAMARQRRAVDLPRLFESVTTGAERGGVAVVGELIERGGWLLGWPPDPRSGPLLLHHLTDAGYASKTASTFPFWQRVFDAVLEQDDPRLIEPLEKVRYTHIYRHFSDAKKRIPWFQERVEHVAQSLRARHPSGLAKLPAVVSREAASLKKALESRPGVSERVRAIVSVVAQPAPEPKAKKRAPKSESGSTLEALERAELAHGKGDLAACLDAILVAWRIAPAVDIAELAQTTSRRVEVQLELITGASREAIQAQWLSIARKRKAADYPRLLGSVTRTMHRTTDSLARLKAIEDRPRDPRTLELVVELLTDPSSYASSTRPFWSSLVELMVEHGDVRAPPRLEALAAGYTASFAARSSDASVAGWFRKQVSSAAERIRAKYPTNPALDEGSLSACTRIREWLHGDAERLLSEIAEHPTDDKLRAVYADLLQERGDPRGELIALQLAGRDAARVKTLLSAYSQHWVGGLGPVLGEVVFERGFLSGVELTEAPASGFAALVGDPIWATVKQITVFKMLPVLHELFAHPVMRSLERVIADDGSRKRNVPFGAARARRH